MTLNELKIIEALAAEIERATAAGDHDRARKLADLQVGVIRGVSQESVSHAIAVPRCRPAPPGECTG
jgi:hypothetical protein